MKTTMTIKQSILALAIALSIVSCKKDKKTDPAPIPVEVKAITLTDLKALSTGATVKVPDGKKISGTVISDASGKNVDGKTVILQEAANQPGIIINFDAAQTFAVGDQLEVNISNQTLTKVNGEVVLDKIPVANAKKSGTGTIAARTTSADEVVKNAAAWDGTLVTLGEGNFTGGDGKYKGTLTFTDAKGAVKSNVLAGAAFENTTYALSVATLTGIVRINGTEVSIDIRSTADVFSGITKTIVEDFSTAGVVENRVFTTTPMGNWINGINAGVNSVLMPPLTGDSFLKAGSNYMYLVKPLTINNGVEVIPGNNSLLTTGYEGQLNGLKVINVTFTGSNFSGDFIDGIQHTSTRPFDASSDKSGISVYLITANFVGVKIGSASYNDVGVLHTLSVKMPANVQELNDRLLAEGYSKDDALSYSNDVFSSATIIVGFNTNSTDRGTVTGYKFGPAIITNITFGISK